jgi:hypothetical protein
LAVRAESDAGESGGTVRFDEPPAPGRAATLVAHVRQFVAAVREGDDAMVEEMVLRLSRSRRFLTPLALVVGGFAMLFNGLKLLFSNWRLTLIQILPAMWIWLAMYDLKAHVLHGKSFNVLRGPILIPLVLVIATITAAAFFLNATFGFAISEGGVPKLRPAFARARHHLGVILTSGFIVGLMLGFSTMVATRWGHPWFSFALSIVIGLMMVCYVAVPSRLIGVKPTSSKRDKLTASAVGGAVGAVVCTPPYLLARLGILMLGTPVLFIPGLVLLAVGATVQAAATGAVKAVKLSAKLIAAHPAQHDLAAVPAGPSGETEAVAVVREQTEASLDSSERSVSR